jgi:rhodanese-related sulfurtransferase
MDHYLTFIQHHWLLCLALVLICLCLLLLEMKEKGGGRVLSPTAAVLWINHDEAMVVDIREDSHYLKGHIIDAQSLPLKNLVAMASTLPVKDKPILLVDSNGQSLPKAMAILQQAGFTQVKGLQGGIVNWQNANLPLVKGHEVVKKA